MGAGGVGAWNLVLVIMVAVGLVLLFSRSRGQDRARTAARLATIERKLDMVMNHLGVAEPPPEEPDVVRHLEQGELLQAIKVYRERTGLGLAESKAAVEQIARERGLEAR